MKKQISFLSLLVGVLIAISFSSCSWERVDAGYVGVKVDLLGSSKGVQNEVLGVGRYFIGMNEDLYKFPTYQVNYVFTKEENEGSTDNEEFTFQTKEGMICSADLGLSMHFDVDKVSEMFQKYRKGEPEIRGIIVRKEIRDALNRVAGTMNVEYVYGEGKGKLIDSVEMIVKKRLNPTGIIIDNLSLISAIRIPPAIEQALNSKVQMTQDAQKSENEVRKAEADAKIKVAKANGEAESMLAIARAEAEANRLKNTTLTPMIVQMRWIEAWEKGGATVPTYIAGSGGSQFLMQMK